MITLEQAKSLEYGDLLHSESIIGTCKRWRITGKVKTWKRNPERVRVPIMFGLYSHDYLTDRDLDIVHLERDCSNPERRRRR